MWTDYCPFILEYYAQSLKSKALDIISSKWVHFWQNLDQKQKYFVSWCLPEKKTYFNISKPRYQIPVTFSLNLKVWLTLEDRSYQMLQNVCHLYREMKTHQQAVRSCNFTLSADWTDKINLCPNISLCLIGKPWLMSCQVWPQSLMLWTNVHISDDW